MMSYYTGTGDVTRSKLASTWESKPLYFVNSRLGLLRVTKKHDLPIKNVQKNEESNSRLAHILTINPQIYMGFWDIQYAPG